MVLHIFFHSQEQVIPVFVIIICRNVLIFFPDRFKYLQIPFFKSGDLFRIWVTGQPGLIPEVDHFLYQTMHFFIPGTVRLIIHAVFQVPQYMGKTFLMVCPIIIKSDIMDKDTLVILRNSSLYSFVPFFARAKYRAFPSGIAHTYT